MKTSPFLGMFFNTDFQGGRFSSFLAAMIHDRIQRPHELGRAKTTEGSSWNGVGKNGPGMDWMHWVD